MNGFFLCPFLPSTLHLCASIVYPYQTVDIDKVTSFICRLRSHYQRIVGTFNYPGFKPWHHPSSKKLD